jgi:hypothetical protein
MLRPPVIDDKAIAVVDGEWRGAREIYASVGVLLRDSPCLLGPRGVIKHKAWALVAPSAVLYPDLCPCRRGDLL